jgi:capsid portal protein
MLVYIPKGKKDGIQIMPIADVTAKDEFSAVKNISRDDMLARTAPRPTDRRDPQAAGGFGNVGQTRDAFYETEIVPLMRRMLRVNDWTGLPVLAFRDYVCSDGSVIGQDGTRQIARAR